MTKKELLDAVRTIVQEEVRTQLPTILIEILSEKTGTPRSVVSESRQQSAARTTTPARPAAPRPPMKFSNNPALNAILNETVGGVPPEDSVPAGIVIPPAALTENAALAPVAEAMNRDYRQVLKAMDKAVNVRRGQLNFKAEIPTNFDQT